MVRCSKILLNVWLLLFLALSIPFILDAMIFYGRRGLVTTQTCFVKVVWIPLFYGITMFILAIIGIFGSLCRFRGLQILFNLIVDIIIIFTLFIMLIYLFALPHYPPRIVWEGVYNHSVPWEEVYPPLTRSLLLHDYKWWRIEHCFQDIHLCDSAHNLTKVPLHPHDRMVYELIIEGCCYPPNRCGLVKKNSSEYQWEARTKAWNISSFKDVECLKWTTISDGKCYDCDTCKASYLSKFHEDWIGVRIFHIIFIVFIIVVTIFVGCGAFTEIDYH